MSRLAESFHGLVDRRLDLIRLGDVGDYADRGAASGLDVRDDRIDVCGSQRYDGNLGAFGCEQLRCRATDAATGARDDGDFAGESTHVHLL